MRVVQKNVYYCDHCRKHGLSRLSMELHERVCTLNPQRECRWKIDGHGSVDIPTLAYVLRERGEPLGETDIDWLRDEVAGCPACMLAVLRQSGLDDFHHGVRRDGSRDLIFDYKAEVDRLRESERATAYGDQW